MKERIVSFVRDIELLDDGYELKEYTEGENTILAAGYFLPSIPGIKYLTLGVTRKDPEYGEIYLPSWQEEIVPDAKNRDEAISYLMTLSGMTKEFAKGLYKAFRENVFLEIRDYKMILKTLNISHEQALTIAASFAGRTYNKALFNYMERAGVSLISCYKASLEDNVEELVRKVPFILVKRNILPFEDADRLSTLAGLEKTSKERIEAALITVLRDMETGHGVFSDGSFPESVLSSGILGNLFNAAAAGWLYYYASGTTLPLDYLYIGALKLLEEPIPKEEILKVIAECPEIFVAHDEGVSYAYLDRVAFAEYSSARRIRKLLDQEFPLKNISKVIKEAEAAIGIKLSLEQIEAVKTSLGSPVSIITGVPGTGKTSVQNVLIEAFQRLSDRPIKLASPTGKASKRMSEVTGIEASTIHRMLGVNMYGEAVDNSTLDAGLIIIDESSMIDSAIFSSLLERVGLGTRLVFVGDVDQLPSVGAGTILSSLIKSERIPTSRLTITFRQDDGSGISINAARIRVGDSSLAFGSDVVFKEARSNDSTSVKEVFSELVKKDGIDNVICLTAFRNHTETGSRRLNETLREALYGNLSGVPFRRVQDFRVYEGDRIMYTQNKKGLVNGDIGTVLKIKGSTLSCNFDGKTVSLTSEDYESIELAYALTVHKSQGAEYKDVILVIDPAHKRMLRRNLVYTGVTRAKKCLYLIGDRSAFNYAVRTPDSSRRTSRLSRLIAL